VFLPPWKSGRVTSFRPLSPKQPASSFNVTPPDVSTPNLSAVQPRSDSSIIQRRQSELPSSASKLSGWLASQRQRLSNLSHRGGSQDDMNAQLWDQNRAERGLSSWEEPSKDSDVFEKAYGCPDSHLAAGLLQPPPIGKLRLEAPRLGRGFTESTTSRYLDLYHSPPETIDQRSWQADSPVFGLNGIVRPFTGESGWRSQGSATVADQDGSSDISNLFRKQEELENSIAGLKLLQGPTGLPSSPSSSKQSATRSDFSLSNFPSPPRVNSPESDYLSEPRRSPSPVRTVRPLRLHPPSVSVDNVPFDLIPPRMPVSVMEHSRTLSLPVSESADSDVIMSARTQRFDSQGTQYDVTSFIGSTSFLGGSSVTLFADALIDLTGSPSTDPPPPGHRKELSGSSNTTGGWTVASSGFDDPEPIATIVTLQQSKQTHVGSPLARMPVISSTTPGMLPATRVMLPSKPRLDISQPQLAFPRLPQDINSDTFERPRAVPSMR